MTAAERISSNADLESALDEFWETVLSAYAALLESEVEECADAAANVEDLSKYN